MKALEAVKNAIVGVLMGIFMMLPGASGATMAVVFGVYERLIRDISKLRTYLLKDIGFLLTLGIGGVIGILICAKGLDFLIDSYEIPIMFFFAVLIAVQIPDIAKNTVEGSQKYTPYNILAFILGFAVMMIVLYIGTLGEGDGSDYGAPALFLAGVLYAVCALSPGISGSTILLALGLLTPVLDALTEIHLSTIAPIIIGAVVGVLCFSKIIDHFVNNSRRSTYCAILGLTLGSIVTVIAQAIMGMDQIDDYVIPCIGAAITGFIIGWGLRWFSRYYNLTVQNNA